MRAAPIALAGVIGGMDSAIGASDHAHRAGERQIPGGIVRKTSSAIKLRTDASMRFEKSQDPANTVRGLARAIEIAARSFAGHPHRGRRGRLRARRSPAPPPIELPLDWLARKLGRAIAADEVRDILERLEFGVSEPQPGRLLGDGAFLARHQGHLDARTIWWKKSAAWSATIPSRPHAPLVAASVPPANPEREFQHEARDLFVDLGFTEVYNYSFIGEEAARAFGLDPAAHVRVANPIASDQALMRASLLPGIWKNIAGEHQAQGAFRLFEIGLEIHKRAAGLAGRNPAPGGGDLRAARRWRGGPVRIEARRRVPDAGRAGDARRGASLTSIRRARRKSNGAASAVGRLFELHPSLVESGRAAVLDLDLRAVRELRAAGAGEVHAGAPLSFERVRSLGDLRAARTCRASCNRASLRPPVRCSNRCEFVRQ